MLDKRGKYVPGKCVGMGKNMRKSRCNLTRAAIAAAALAVAAAAPGCLPAKQQATRPAPVVDTETPNRDYAYWRSKYVKNRMVPPEQYSVRAVPSRNNEFGEFDEAMYSGLDRQPELPPMPGDAAVMPAVGGPATYSMAASSYQGGGTAYPQTRAPAASRPSSASSASSAPRAQGVAAENHFYPVEQLVYGGEYPDIDRPDVYRLMPRDVVSVTVRDHPEFSGKLVIQADGTVRIPNSPDLIRVRGMTVDEAADEIRKTLAVYVRGDCVVRVQANRARGGYYFVFGDVKQPGRFPMGLEEIRLSEAVMAANFEVNPNRLDEDEELGPAFPTASPRGKFVTPRSADMARVMLITPHRSQPVRTTHDLRQAMLGMTAGDPLVRPGQIIVVPSLDPEKNLELGLAMGERPATPEGLLPGQGFSTANSPARLPEVLPYAETRGAGAGRVLSDVESNMIQAYGVQANVEATPVRQFPEEDEYCDVLYDADGYEIVAEETIAASRPVVVESVNPVLPRAENVLYETPAPAQGRRLKKAPFANAMEPAVAEVEPATTKRKAGEGFPKGF